MLGQMQLENWQDIEEMKQQGFMPSGKVINGKAVVEFKQ